MSYIVRSLTGAQATELLEVLPRVRRITGAKHLRGAVSTLMERIRGIKGWMDNPEATKQLSLNRAEADWLEAAAEVLDMDIHVQELTE